MDNFSQTAAFIWSVADLLRGDFNGLGKELGEKFTESNMNPDLKKRDLRKAFDSDDYQVMLVANKFQTGFDQPKLCAMYVDKKQCGDQQSV